MNRLLACVLGWSALALFAGVALADEPADEGDEKKKDVIHVEKDNEIRVFRTETKTKAKPAVYRVVLKDGTPVFTTDGALTVHRAEAKDGSIVIEFSDGDRKIVKQVIRLDDADGKVRVLEGKVADAEGKLHDVEVDVKVDGARKKATVLLEKIEDLLEDVEKMPWLEMAESFVDENVMKEMKDLEIIIKTPDGKTHKLGGKDGKLSAFLKKYRYEPGPTPFVWGPKKGDHAGLHARMKRLEEQNHRLQQELELMRRRLNEMAAHRHKPKTAPAAIARRVELRPHRAAKASSNDRLARIEALLEVLLERKTMEGAKPAPRRFRERIGGAIERAKPKLERAKAKLGALGRDVKAKSPEKIHEMLKRSQARIEALMRELETKRAETERLKSEIK